MFDASLDIADVQLNLAIDGAGVNTRQHTNSRTIHRSNVRQVEENHLVVVVDQLAETRLQFLDILATADHTLRHHDRDIAIPFDVHTHLKSPFLGIKLLVSGHAQDSSCGAARPERLSPPCWPPVLTLLVGSGMLPATASTRESYHCDWQIRETT